MSRKRLHIAWTHVAAGISRADEHDRMAGSCRGRQRSGRLKERVNDDRSFAATRLLRFARNDTEACHCEERRDEAISAGLGKPAEIGGDLNHAV